MKWSEIKQRRGVVTQVAKALNISTAAVSQWDEVPQGRREQVANLLGVKLADSSGAPAREDAA